MKSKPPFPGLSLLAVLALLFIWAVPQTSTSGEVQESTAGNLAAQDHRPAAGGIDIGSEVAVPSATAIGEPSTYLLAAGLLGLMLWPSRKRLLKDAKKILGLTPPMRDRLAARREQRLKAEA